MKSSKTLLLLVLTVFMVQCDKLGGDPPAKMTATINGTEWEATEIGASIFNGWLNVTGTTADFETIAITLMDDQEGTYTLNQESTAGAVYSASYGAIGYTSNGNDAAGGTVVVEEIDLVDSLMSGTFEFVCFQPSSGDSVVITEGSFKNVSFKPVTEKEDDSFSADIDGESFTAQSVSASCAMGRLMIGGSPADGSRTVGLVLPEDATVGAHDLDGVDYDGQYSVGTTLYSSTLEGNITITKHDLAQKRIEGTFDYELVEFMGSETVSITNGAFAVNYSSYK